MCECRRVFERSKLAQTGGFHHLMDEWMNLDFRPEKYATHSHKRQCQIVPSASLLIFIYLADLPFFCFFCELITSRTLLQFQQFQHQVLLQLKFSPSLPRNSYCTLPGSICLWDISYSTNSWISTLLFVCVIYYSDDSFLFAVSCFCVLDRNQHTGGSMWQNKLITLIMERSLVFQLLQC